MFVICQKSVKDNTLDDSIYKDLKIFRDNIVNSLEEVRGIRISSTKKCIQQQRNKKEKEKEVYQETSVSRKLYSKSKDVKSFSFENKSIDSITPAHNSYQSFFGGDGNTHIFNFLIRGEQNIKLIKEKEDSSKQNKSFKVKG